MVGYQMMIPDYRFTTSVGIDWQDNRLSPEDADNPVSGSKTGFVIQADLETVEPKPIYVGLIGQYSTANRWYWSRARTGYAFGKVVVGPEGIVLGNIGFEGWRLPKLPAQDQQQQIARSHLLGRVSMDWRRRRKRGSYWKYRRHG